MYDRRIISTSSSDVFPCRAISVEGRRFSERPFESSLERKIELYQQRPWYNFHGVSSDTSQKQATAFHFASFSLLPEM
jgi:hypothetical protein